MLHELMTGYIIYNDLKNTPKKGDNEANFIRTGGASHEPVS
jgi:hypothetical protein